MSVFNLPDLGEGLPDATVREWYVKVGDEVAVDQPLVAMETAKALVDVPSPTAGVIDVLHGDVGDEIDTGSPLVSFVSDSPAAPLDTTQDAGTVVGDIETSNTVVASEKQNWEQSKAPTTTNTSAALATPRVRALAQELGISLDRIAKPGIPVSAADVIKAASILPKTSQHTHAGHPVKLNSARRAMIASMAQSRDHVVPVTLTDDAVLVRWSGKQDTTVRILRAIEHAAQVEPSLNGSFCDLEHTLYQAEHVNIGLAVDTPDGLFVPVLKNTGGQSDSELRETINRFKTQAQEKTFPPNDLKGSTIMLSNFGTFAGRYANPVLVPPLVSIIGIGRARDEIICHDGQPTPGRVLPISVTADHRAVTGGEISRFLAALIERLERPE